MSLSLRKPQPILWITPIVLLLIAAKPQTQKIVAQGTAATQKAVVQGTAATQKAVIQAAQEVKQQVIDIWEGDENSLVAEAVGRAEGTRGSNGSKNQAYQGHTDPGNGVHNLGTFSYQGCPDGCAPEEADRRQLARLLKQAEVIYKQAGRKDNLNLVEIINGLDLANQSPLAALDAKGFAGQLALSKKKGLKGYEAILDARVNSFRGSSGAFEAPGLGNTLADVRYDQGRRMDRIDDTIAAKKLTGKEQVK